MRTTLPDSFGKFWTFLPLYVCSVFFVVTSRSLFYSSVQSIEREFGFSSGEVGMFGTGSKISYILFSIPIAYLSSRMNRARWVGMGYLLITIGSGLYALPHLMFTAGSGSEGGWAGANGTGRGLSLCVPEANSLRLLHEEAKCHASTAAGTNGSNRPAFWIFFLANVLSGFGWCFGWNISTPLIDDNVPKKSAPLYFGVIRFLIVMGPFTGLLVGAALMNQHYSLRSVVGLGPEDPTWIGAYWLGYAALFLLSLPSVLLLALFPDTLERKRKLRQASQASADAQRSKTLSTDSAKDKDPSHDPLLEKPTPKEHHNPSPITFITAEAKGFVKSLVGIFKSKIYVVYLFASLMSGFAFRGWFTFLTKFINNYYDISQSQASVIMGFTDVLSYASGNVVGSYLTKRLRLEGRRAATWVIVGFGTYWCLYWAALGLRCTSTISAVGEEWAAGGGSLALECNEGCGCEGLGLKPVCDGAGRAFFNPCWAGCGAGGLGEGNFTACACASDGGWVSRERCSDDCAVPAILYCAILTASGFIQGLIGMPMTLFLLRSVPAESRSLGLALQGFLKSTVATLPSPVVYGAVIDATCRIWEWRCGQRRSCAVYDTQALLFYLHLLLNVFLGLSLLFKLLLWYFAKEFPLLSSPKVSGASTPTKSLADSPSDSPHASVVDLQALPSRTGMV